jgi:hypothetical protein
MKFEIELPTKITLDENSLISLIKESYLASLEEGTVSKINRGNVAEAILGTALYTKFLLGKEITRADVENQIKNISGIGNTSSSKDYIEKTITQNITSKKNVSLRMKFLSTDFNAFQDPKYIKDAYEIDSAIQFANTAKNVEDIVNKFLKLRSDQVNIDCIGLDDQKGTKADVRVASKNLGDKIISLSLKTLTKQLGQVGINWRTDPTAKKQIRGISDVLEGLFSISLDDKVYKEKYEVAVANRGSDREAVIKVIKNVYEDAAKQATILAAERKQSDDNSYIDFLKNLAVGISKEATGGEADIHLLQLKKGSFNLIDFSKLEKRMEDLKKDCDISVKCISAALVPYIQVFLNISNEDGSKPESHMLISIRPKIRPSPSNEFRHYIQKESGLTALLSNFHK